MPNLGEEICGDYLQFIKECDFITYNTINPDIQGEIDVIGINLKDRKIYICEVAIHTSGLHYVKDKSNNNQEKVKEKFIKDIVYAQEYYSDYTIFPMLWSPIVKSSKENSKNNAIKDLEAVEKYIKEEYRLTLELIINEKFDGAITQLRDYAVGITSEFKSNVMRMFQIEEKLKKHLEIQKKKETKKKLYPI